MRKPTDDEIEELANAMLGCAMRHQSIEVVNRDALLMEAAIRLLVASVLRPKRSLHSKGGELYDVIGDAVVEWINKQQSQMAEAN